MASRKDTRACGEKCKSRRQAGYFKEHKEKVKDDVVDITYQRNRDGYNNFLKKLARLNAPDDMVNSYNETKYDFLENGKKKRKAYKDGELKKSELMDWIRADKDRRLRTEQDILGDIE